MIKLLWQSFGNVNAYAYVLKQWRWKFVVYFFTISILSGFLISLVKTPEIVKQLDENKDFIIAQFPNGKIENSKFTMPVPSPYFIKSKSGTNIIGFTYDFLEPSQIQTLFFAFEKDRLSFYFDNDETYFFYDKLVNDYNKVTGLDSSANAPVLINKTSAEEFLNYAKSISFFILTPFFLAISLIANAVLVMSITLPAFLLSLTYLPNLKILGALKISIIAASPAIILQTIQALLGFPNISEIFFVLISYYIVWRVIKKLSQKAISDF